MLNVGSDFTGQGGRVPARIGTLEMVYQDPAVSVTTEQRVVEHETIDDNVVIQTLGRKPDQISIEGVVTDRELVVVDGLTTLGIVSLRTERWKGKVVVKSTSTDFKRAKTEDGDWLYDATIECVEVNEDIEEQLNRQELQDLTTLGS